MNILNTSEVAVVENYPYGRLTTKAMFSVEFKKGKGFRSVFQTINPKNGVYNKEKKGTYYPVLVMTDDNGFVRSKAFDFNGAEAINKGCEFMSDNFDKFSNEQIKDIFAHIFQMLKVESHCIVAYCGANFEDVKPLLENSVKMAVRGFKDGENLFKEILIDIEKLNALKKPDFNPFVTKESFVIKM